MAGSPCHPLSDDVAGRTYFLRFVFHTAVAASWFAEFTQAMQQISTIMQSNAAKVFVPRQVEKTRAMSQEQYQRIAANLPGMVFQGIIQPDGGIELPFVSEGCQAIYGLTPQEITADPSLVVSIIHPEDRAAFTHSIRETSQRLVPWHWEGRIVTRIGQIKWVQGTSLPERQADGAVICEGLLCDVTERREAQEALREAERSYRSIFENSLDGIFQTTPAGQYLRVNAALARIYGYETPDALIQGLQDITRQLYVDPERRQEFVRLMQERGAVSNFEAQIYRRNGSLIWIAEHARAVRDDEGRLIFYEGTVQDITERKALEAERERLLAEALEQADHDPLTGLLNHRAFHKRFGEETARAEREGTTLAVAMLDLDNFKFFNDSYGHAAGDDVLRRVAETLRAGCRRYDVLARFGGDEFALLMPETGDGTAASLTARLKALLEAAGYRPAASEVAIPLTLSAGLAVYPDDGHERHQVLEAADARLMHTKTGGSDDQFMEDLRSTLTDSVAGFSMLDALVTAVDNKDRYTRRHSEDVMRHALQIGRAMGLDEAMLRTLQVAALLHDVGKIGVPDRILRKPGRLTEEEFEAVQQHPMMGAVIVGAVAGFENTLDAVRHHHERWDGQGYPFGLAGEETPLLARIMAVADAFSAMTTDRPYRKGKCPEEARAILAAGAGGQWDPACIAAFERTFTARPPAHSHLLAAA